MRRARHDIPVTRRSDDIVRDTGAGGKPFAIPFAIPPPLWSGGAASSPFAPAPPLNVAVGGDAEVLHKPAVLGQLKGDDAAVEESTWSTQLSGGGPGPLCWFRLMFISYDVCCWRIRMICVWCLLFVFGFWVFSVCFSSVLSVGRPCPACCLWVETLKDQCLADDNTLVNRLTD